VAPKPIATTAPAVTVLLIPEVVVMGERPKPKRHEAEPEAVHERVFCDQWPIVGQPLVAGDGPDERHQRRNMFAMAIPTLVVPQ
jgi:hypothetical protein